MAANLSTPEEPQVIMCDFTTERVVGSDLPYAAFVSSLATTWKRERHAFLHLAQLTGRGEEARNCFIMNVGDEVAARALEASERESLPEWLIQGGAPGAAFLEHIGKGLRNYVDIYAKDIELEEQLALPLPKKTFDCAAVLFAPGAVNSGNFYAGYLGHIYAFLQPGYPHPGEWLQPYELEDHLKLIGVRAALRNTCNRLSGAPAVFVPARLIEGILGRLAFPATQTLALIHDPLPSITPLLRKMGFSPVIGECESLCDYTRPLAR